jgi:hypothetical protein
MKKIIEIHDALMSLMPNVRFSVEDNDFDKIEIQDAGVTAVSRQDIQNEMERLQAIEDAIEYQHNRREQYPEIGEQLDMLWHSIDSGSLDKTSDFYLSLKLVKDNNPKT